MDFPFLCKATATCFLACSRTPPPLCQSVDIQVVLRLETSHSIATLRTYTWITTVLLSNFYAALPESPFLSLQENYQGLF